MFKVIIELNTQYMFIDINIIKILLIFLVGKSVSFIISLLDDSVAVALHVRWISWLFLEFKQLVYARA